MPKGGVEQIGGAGNGWLKARTIEERQVGIGTHEWNAAENPDHAIASGLCRTKVGVKPRTAGTAKGPNSLDGEANLRKPGRTKQE